MDSHINEVQNEATEGHTANREIINIKDNIGNTDKSNNKHINEHKTPYIHKKNKKKFEPSKNNNHSGFLRKKKNKEELIIEPTEDILDYISLTNPINNLNNPEAREAKTTEIKLSHHHNNKPRFDPNHQAENKFTNYVTKEHYPIFNYIKQRSGKDIRKLDEMVQNVILIDGDLLKCKSFSSELLHYTVFNNDYESFEYFLSLNKDLFSWEQFKNQSLQSITNKEPKLFNKVFETMFVKDFIQEPQRNTIVNFMPQNIWRQENIELYVNWVAKTINKENDISTIIKLAIDSRNSNLLFEMIKHENYYSIFKQNYKSYEEGLKTHPHKTIIDGLYNDYSNIKKNYFTKKYDVLNNPKNLDLANLPFKIETKKEVNCFLSDADENLKVMMQRENNKPAINVEIKRKKRIFVN